MATSAVAQQADNLVTGPRHSTGANLEHTLAAECPTGRVVFSWSSQVAEVRVSVEERTDIFGPDHAFVRDLFGPGTRPVDFWIRCGDTTFDLGATIVVAGPHSPVFAVPALWFTYEPALGEYTGLQVEPAEIAYRRLD